MRRKLPEGVSGFFATVAGKDFLILDSELSDEEACSITKDLILFDMPCSDRVL
ncbi:hypothetical protein [Heliorestis convoluta]|uniref:Uncharacterized protein n=1 Tax=Heliorestis convoluta TaxID=356322 RepID=A0A5Q2N3P8_9FIRM|nr:hypothetical protein [Heliorestis convoluta]QGG47205.1 hypothetical protein FTV88_1053 [Heliorestis convoluta]